MSLLIFFILFILLIISFLLAYRSLSELEVPKEVLEKIKKGQTLPKFWGIIIFLKGKKTLYYHSASETSEEAEISSSNNSSNNFERIEV